MISVEAVIFVNNFSLFVKINLKSVKLFFLFFSEKKPYN